MRTLTYKREWLAKERVKRALKEGSLVSWWRSKDRIVVVVKVR